jgi:protein-S-isoprenylcysteine O-methyltransferase Ste14
MKASYIIKHIAGMLLFYSVLFLSAGKLNYAQGLTYLVIGLIMIGMNYTFLRIDPELLKERSQPGENSLKWDKIILGLSFLNMLAMFIIAGLDSGRYHWSPEFPAALTWLGIIFTISGQLLFLIAQKQNYFFSSTVRIQTNRAHRVCESGLYSFVRHPAYMGSIIQAIGFPLLFGSVWSLIPVTLLIILTFIRTQKEDTHLQNELEGYTMYSSKIHYRIIPYIW